MKSTSSILVIVFLCICFFVLGILTEKIVLNKFITEYKKKGEEFRSLTDERKFTNPLLDCEPEFTFISKELEYLLNDRVSYHKKNPSIAQVSVYFRNLNGGAWYGVNEREKFIPGSLNKVPLMIAAFKLSEYHPKVLDFNFAFDELTSTFSQLKDDAKPVAGEKLFTYFDIIEYMIKYSHNETASFLLELMSSIDSRFVEKVFTDLGIQAPNSTDVFELTTKDYASFFRILYNCTYINFKNSEMALYFLSETEFRDGLVKGIEDNIVISHKYGQISDNKLMQLHDCGIIYYPGNTYILCVMVKGYDINRMADIIQDISKEVYKEVKTQVLLQ